MLHAYFDDSGTHSNSDIVVWAGFVVSEKKWTAFDAEWRVLLANPDWKLSHFHMYDVVHGDGECMGWEQGKRDRCIYEFREIILKHGLHGIGNTISKKDWEEIVIPSKIFSYPAESFGLSAAIALTRHHKQDEDEISIIFDNTKRDVNAVNKGIDYYKNDGGKPKLVDVLFVDMKQFTGLQAADMLAWETYRYGLDYLEKGDYPEPSPHFRHFLEKCELNGEFFNRRRIIKLVENAVPRPAFSSLPEA